MSILVFGRNYKSALEYCRKLLLHHHLAWLSRLQQVGVAQFIANLLIHVISFNDRSAHCY